MQEQQGPIKEQLAFVSDERANTRHFGNYDLVRRIDVGGMGEVYLARQRTAFGREVAVKIIRSDLVHDITARKRFLREAEVSAHLKHEHILPLVEFGEEQGRLFLVTPYIQGGTLARRLQSSGPLSLAETRQLFSALVQAVAYIHKRGVIHRDLKPSNILLDREEDSDQVYVRLIDFGIASIQGMAAGPALTTAENEMGTLAYMAPERLNGIAAPSNDIYSLGVMLYQMLAGQLPSTGTVTLPPSLEQVVQRCIAPDPLNRFASADALLRAFEQACQTLSAEEQNKTFVAQNMLPEELSPVTPGRSGLPLSFLPPVERDNGSASSKLSSQEDLFSSPQSTPGYRFSQEDYNAPTSFLGPQRLPDQAKQLANVAVAPRTPRQRGRGRKISPLAIIPLSITLILFLLIGLLLFGFQFALTADISISPQVHAFSNTFTMTARPGLRAVDAATNSIPANVLTSTKTGSQQGPTTGVAQCVLGIFNCKQAVSFLDVITISAQLRPTVKLQIDQDLQRQERSLDALSVGNTFYNDVNVNSDPAVGSVSKTVTVTLTEQGSVEYLKAKDVHDLAVELLQQQMLRQFGQNYTLIDQLTQISQPVVQSVGSDGSVKVAVSAGGVAKYQISATDIRDIQNAIKGLNQKDARTLIAKRPGLDTNAISIHISYGEALPNNIEQIKITVVNPANLPPVQLPQAGPKVGVTPTASNK